MPRCTLLRAAGILAAFLFTSPVGAQLAPAELKASVVLIERPREGGMPREIGSGFFVSSAGHILTAGHVLLESDEQDEIVGRRRLVVRLAGQPKGRQARVLALNRFTDLALIKIKAETPTPYLPLGTAATVSPGDVLTIVGHPVGRQEWNLSVALVDSITADERIFVQATLFEGQSGGPAIDTEGRVVGVVAYREAGPRLSYLAPIDDAIPLVAGLTALTTGARPAAPALGPAATPSVLRIREAEEEDNDDFQSANIIALAQTKTGLLARVAGVVSGEDDKDTFRVDFDSRDFKRIVVVLRFRKERNSVIQIDVIDKNFMNIGKDLGNPPHDLALKFVPKPNAPYYLQIWQSYGQAIVDYDLFITAE